MKNYGIPYMGSKNKLADKICSLFPCADNFYDLFAGGCAITHYLLSNRDDLFVPEYKNYYVNDISDTPTLFLNALQGKYKNETRWISREDFFKLKDTDPYIATCWSFGNNKRTYLYSPENEIIKKALHYAIVFNDFSLLKEQNVILNKEKYKTLSIKERRLNICKDVKKILNIKHLHLHSLEGLQRVQSIENNNIILPSVTMGDYRDITIRDNSIVYCDIPYKNTGKYSNKNKRITFDHDSFYTWCFEIAKNKSIKLFISSYEMPEEFKVVAEFEHMSSMSVTAKNKKVIEKVFTL